MMATLSLSQTVKDYIHSHHNGIATTTNLLFASSPQLGHHCQTLTIVVSWLLSDLYLLTQFKIAILFGDMIMLTGLQPVNNLKPLTGFPS